MIKCSVLKQNINLCACDNVLLQWLKQKILTVLNVPLLENIYIFLSNQYFKQTPQNIIKVYKIWVRQHN